MRITLPLLGRLNHGAPANFPLRPKHVSRVTAETLAQLLIYDRAGSRKTDRFKIRPSSTILIDKEIQRGLDNAGFHLQQPAKIREISDILLGIEGAPPFGYFGTLIWNVRPPGTLTLAQRQIEGKPPEYELIIDADNIHLTDSAHRHFGIVEAFNRYLAAPSRYPRFRRDAEFAVEVYNLTKTDEKSLFAELNSKQKKITAAKMKEMDVTSPTGAVKDAIVEHDSEGRRLFHQNIEVSSNRNDKHTLMTMSVFVSSIHEMFTTSEIKESRSNADLREELAEHYCQFFYALHDNIRVRIPMPDGSEREMTPYYNLYTEIIGPAEAQYEVDSVEAPLVEARTKANELNAHFRLKDISNGNTVLKALCRLGGTIRKMTNWYKVIERLQVEFVAPSQGRFFQMSNPEWTMVQPGMDTPIATANADGTSLNVQVISANVNRVYDFLRRKLHLQLRDSLSIKVGEDFQPLTPGIVPTIQLVRNAENTRVIQLSFSGVGAELPDEDLIRLSVEPSIDWKAGLFSGARKLSPSNVERDRSYVHEHYEDIARYVAIFEVPFPQVKVGAEAFELQLTATFPDIDNTSIVTNKGKLNVVLSH